MKILTFVVIMAVMTIPQTSSSQTREPGVYATFHTSMGKIVCKLYDKEAPRTVANFIGLATGKKAWTHPATSKAMRTPLYSGTVFHRVIPQFMIQGGDPMASGMGGPGYKFEDEFVPSLGFDKPGRLAMANSGPNTNGSQFFITEVPTPHLNQKHTIFGQVIEGQELVAKIGQAGNKAVKLEQITIEGAVQGGTGVAAKKRAPAAKASVTGAAKKSPAAKK